MVKTSEKRGELFWKLLRERWRTGTDTMEGLEEAATGIGKHISEDYAAMASHGTSKVGPVSR